MNQSSPAPGSLRERKQRRARQAIVAAADALFDERGFDAVTVNDIVARAEVGRATFFRYFGDKQEVLFGEDPLDDAFLAELRAIESERPIGASLPAALSFLRRAVARLVSVLVADPDGYRRHERLVAAHPELRARSLSKQRRYVPLMAELLRERGAEESTAVLAAELALACYNAGSAECGGAPERLPAAVDAAFARLE